MTWRDVFDSDKFYNQGLGSITIYKVNEFVLKYTYYAYFSFNGTIFPVRPVEQFDTEYVTFHYKNGLKVNNLQ